MISSNNCMESDNSKLVTRGTSPEKIIPGEISINSFLKENPAPKIDSKNYI
jgi:hypothetical protein